MTREDRFREWREYLGSGDDPWPNLTRTSHLDFCIFRSWRAHFKIIEKQFFQGFQMNLPGQGFG